MHSPAELEINRVGKPTNETKEESNPMKTISMVFCAFLLTESLVLGAESPRLNGVLSSVQIPGSSYCHLRFPAIREETLSSNEPSLNTDSNDIIDFYGSCDHDPLGKDEIQAQKSDARRRRNQIKD